MIGTYVLCPQRVVPLAYTPGVVIGTLRGLFEVKIPHAGRWLYQCFTKEQLIVMNPPSPIENIDRARS